MGNSESRIKTVNFDNIKHDKHILINVMDEKDQSVLIKGTLTIEDEIKILNSKQRETCIIIYGKNTDDYEKIVKRYNQLRGLGFDACVYFGGLFEWLLLQEIYGISEFPIEKHGSVDVLKYAPKYALEKSRI